MKFDESIVELIKANVTSFPSIPESRNAIAKCFDSFGNAEVLLIGDGSHGTSEFYAMRAEITKYMIEHHGFNIVAGEADWPDAEAIDRYVRHRSGHSPQDSVGSPFKRFPTWMWRNREVRDFVRWLREWNAGKDVHDAVGFYGLDLYSLVASMRAVIRYLDEIDEGMAGIARERYDELMMFAENPKEYGHETFMAGLKGYEEEVISMLQNLLRKRLEYSAARWDGEEFHSGEQNARVVKDAEQYYKAIYYGRVESWNIRDSHMFETLTRILKHRGEGSKAIVWAHNSHIGDARFTNMGRSRRKHNISQLFKQTFGQQALNIGCSTYTGTVAAADRWGQDMRVMHVTPASPDSYEALMHATGIRNFMLDLREKECSKELR